MRPPLPLRLMGERRTLRFRFDLIHGCARLFVDQQTQLQIAQCLAARPQQFHAILPQLFSK